MDIIAIVVFIQKLVIYKLCKITNSNSKSGKVTELTTLKEGQTINMIQMAVIVGANKNKLNVLGRVSSMRCTKSGKDNH